MQVVHVVLCAYGIWLLFVLYAGATVRWSALHWLVKSLMMPIIVLFGVLDILLNVLVGSLLFVDPPPSFKHVEAFKGLWYWTIMHRVTVYRNNHSAGWRYRLAGIVCAMADPFHDGHCGDRGLVVRSRSEHAEIPGVQQSKGVGGGD